MSRGNNFSFRLNVINNFYRDYYGLPAGSSFLRATIHEDPMLSTREH